MCNLKIICRFAEEITTKIIEIMKTSTKQNLTQELLKAGFDKKDFNLKKVGGFLTLIVSELNLNSFKACELSNKYGVDLQYSGFVYGAQAIYAHLGLTCDITTLC